MPEADKLMKTKVDTSAELSRPRAGFLCRFSLGTTVLPTRTANAAVCYTLAHYELPFWTLMAFAGC
jgi:hypothetical protein